MKISPSVMAAPVTRCAAHHCANRVGNQCEAPYENAARAPITTVHSRP
jgi:hypothetical protein